MDASQIVAGNIRAALARQQLTRADLARRLGVHVMWVTRRANGQVMTVDDLARIADALGVSMATLLTETAA